MKQSYYEQAKFSIDHLNYSQLRKIKVKVKSIQSKRIVANTLEKKRKKLTCSHCGSLSIVRWGRQSDLQRYKCKDCRRTFNSLTGTPLARLKRKGHWLDYAKCLIEGKSIRKSAFICGVDKTTSFRWRHRFLINTNNLVLEKLKGIIEINEIEKKKSYKGARNVSKEKLEKQEKIFVVFARDRYGNTIDSILENLVDKELQDKLDQKLSKDNLLCTDKKQVYFNFAKNMKYQHGFIDIINGVKIKKDIIHIDNVVNYHSELDDWMKRFRGVATKYLKNYLSWYRGMDETNMKMKPKKLLRRAIVKC